jgi:hypothetical protein
MTTGEELQAAIEGMAQSLELAADGAADAIGDAPQGEGEWSPKQVLMHVLGPEGATYQQLIQSFIESDNPAMEGAPGTLHTSPDREAATFSDLLTQAVEDHRSLATYVGGLSDDQLNKVVDAPVFAATPWGAKPTVAQIVEFLGDWHVRDHTASIKMATLTSKSMARVTA